MQVQVTHLDVFMALTILRKQYPFLDEYHITESIRTNTGIPVYSANVKGILAYPPSTKYQVQWLRDKGYSPGFIAQYLSIAPPTVSYHLSTNVKSEYKNPQITVLQRPVHSTVVVDAIE